VLVLVLLLSRVTCAAPWLLLEERTTSADDDVDRDEVSDEVADVSDKVADVSDEVADLSDEVADVSDESDDVVVDWDVPPCRAVPRVPRPALLPALLLLLLLLLLPASPELLLPSMLLLVTAPLTIAVLLELLDAAPDADA
jgi:hypothetical protein